MTDAFPLVASDGITGRNNAHDIRRGLLAAILGPDVKTDPLAVRNGVFPHDFDVSGVTSLRVDQTTTPSTAFLVHAGSFICERAGQGPYLGWEELSAGLTITPTAADGANPRIDVVYAHVQDKASIGTDSTTDPLIGVLAGTASATPVVPTGLPDGAVPLAQILRPAAVSTIITSRITDVRKSTGLLGAARLLLPGDFTADPGKVTGDIRLRPPTGSLPLLLDYWDATQSKWRGTQELTFSTLVPGTPSGAGQVTGHTTAGSNTRLTIATITVPDPGWPYRVQSSCSLYLTGGACNVFVSVNNGPFSSAIMQRQAADSAQQYSFTPTDSGVITGSCVVRLNMDPLGSFTQVNYFTDIRNSLVANVVPA